MQFFEKMRERLYPVGRLDYMSEGLLLVTNDGELANKLTRAAVGRGEDLPGEGGRESLRKTSWIFCERAWPLNKGKPGEGKVRTSPARIRQVRQGDNPWYEVVLIEGRNRELRKMFEEIGHFVEKIRRVGYGPLILDQEPGKMRELDAQELELLRKAADGKLKTPKAKEVRRRNREDATGPEKPAFRKERGAGPVKRRAPANESFDRKMAGGQRGKFERGPAKFGRGPAADAPKADGGFRKKEDGWKVVEGRGRPAGKGFGARPAGARPPAARPFGERPATGRSFPPKPTGGRPFGTKPAAGRSFPPKPAWKRGEERPQRDFKRPFTPRPETPRPPVEASDEQAPKRPFRLHIEPVQGFERGDRPAARPDRPRQDRPQQDRGTGSGRPSFGRTGAGRSEGSRPQGRQSSTGRPFRPQGGTSRPFTTSSGKPRAGGARPSSKPAGRPGAQRPEGEARPERRTGTGWKPKPAFGGKSKPAGRTGAKPGGFSRPGSKGAPSRGGGSKRSGPRPGGKGPGRGGKRG